MFEIPTWMSIPTWIIFGTVEFIIVWIKEEIQRGKKEDTSEVWKTYVWNPWQISEGWKWLLDLVKGFNRLQMKEHDWVDSDNHIIDRNSLLNHTDQYIRQLLTATFDEMGKRNKERTKIREIVSAFQC